MVPFRTGSRRGRRSIDHNDHHQQQQKQHHHHHHHHHNYNHNHRRRRDDPRNTLEWTPEPDPFIMTFPIHPLPAMQAPFEESMLDATGETAFVPFPTTTAGVDRRQESLCRDNDASELDWNPTYNCHWRTTAQGKYHPLLKTIAQIVFGVHLLHQHLEKSVADVADILLKHVNELDGFLQRANEDIEGSLTDMLFRRKCLKVPMEHVSEFDRLLEDRTYRAQLLDGNVVIERTIQRMSELLNDYLADLSMFRDATGDLDMYLAHIGSAWTQHSDDMARIYSAMCGNTAGWSQFLQSVIAKAERLGVVLVQVSSYCNEIEKRCGAASRRSLIASRSSSRSTNSRDAAHAHARSFRNFANNKPLPSVPNERSPFTPSSPAGDVDVDSGSDLPIQRPGSSSSRGSRYTSSGRSRMRALRHTESDESLRPRKSPSGLSVSMTIRHEKSAPDLTVQPREPAVQPQYDHGATTWQPHGNRPDEGDRPRDEYTHITIRHDMDSPQTDQDQAHSDSDQTILSKRIIVNTSSADLSPPLTGKDSAYSSISGSSFASPTGPHLRSVSAQSSYPRAQFGLFPSSVPGTPKPSPSGRDGSLSPAFASSRAMDSPTILPPRAQTSLDNHAPSSRSLLKKTSLSSLRRLFGGKRNKGVDSIAE